MAGGLLSMRSLLVVAHGSRRQAANDEVEALTKVICQQLVSNNPLGITRVSTAFLELAEPSIEQGIDALLTEGSQDIWLMPYFLTNGRHVSVDIPEIVESFQMNLPKDKPATIRILPYLGQYSAMAQTLIQAMSEFDSGQN